MHSRWFVPKHVKLAVSLQLLTDCADIVSILNWCSNCQSEGKLLELETAVASRVRMVDGILIKHYHQQ